VKVAAIQMDCIPGNRKDNLAKSISLLEESIDCGAKLVVLPELFSTGYWVKDLDMELAETIPGETTLTLESIAKERNIYISGAILEHGEARGLIYDTAFIITPKGNHGIYRKICLWDTEKNRFKSASASPSVFNSDIGYIGLQICYEIGFPEGARMLTMQGADILLYPSAFGKPRLYIWDIATRSRAIENGVYLIAANRSGTEDNGKIEFAGHSRIVNPKGEILAQAENTDQVILADLDLNMIAEQRRAVPYLSDLPKLELLTEQVKKVVIRKEGGGNFIETGYGITEDG
jgi:predicted amidohydrolase